MFWDLIATFAAGFGGAGIAMVANIISGKRLPRWLVPVAAGGCMIGYAIWSEYTWYERTAATLPEGITVTQSVEGAALWRPWTYAFPMVERFATVDLATFRFHPDAPDTALVNQVFFARWSAPQMVPVAFRCDSAERAVMGEGVSLGADGAITGADWIATDRADASLVAVCDELARRQPETDG